MVASKSLTRSRNGAVPFKAMSGEAQLMLMIAGMHLLGLVCVAVLIIPALREGPGMAPRNDSGSDDGGGWGRRRPPSRQARRAAGFRWRTAGRPPSAFPITDGLRITNHRASAG